MENYETVNDTIIIKLANFKDTRYKDTAVAKFEEIKSLFERYPNRLFVFDYDGIISISTYFIKYFIKALRDLKSTPITTDINKPLWISEKINQTILKEIEV